MDDALRQPESKVQPVRVLPQLEAHRQEARAGGVDDLVGFRAFYTRDVLLFGAVAGPEDGTPVVLLHGFPDFWLGWARQIRPLVEAGCRVLIPDQRGYNRSEKPPGIDAYRLPELSADIIDLLDAVGWESAHLAGHDWGAAVSWSLADHHPERLESVTILNCPHPDEMARALLGNNRRQMLRSWYIGLFQLPHLPEWVARASDFRFLEMALSSASPGAFTDDELAAYRRAWGQEGALTAMINWYRAAGRAALGGGDATSETPSNGAKIEVPLRIVWGRDDKALDESLVEPSAERAEDARIEWVDDASHWVRRDAPEVVNRALLETVGS